MMIEAGIVRGAIHLYQNTLYDNGLTPNTSRVGEMAYNEDGLPGLWEIFKDAERPRACELEGLPPNGNPSVWAFAYILAKDILHGLRIMAGNMPDTTDVSWQLYSPEPAPQPNRLMQGNMPVAV